jgi:thiosulfate dehydrogenase [quinone] large subunit
MSRRTITISIDTTIQESTGQESTGQESTGQTRKRPRARYALGITRVMLGWIFLWTFLDKLFGLGKYTPAGQGWIDGGSPTEVFAAANLKTGGPFQNTYRSVAGTALADTLFMIGLAVIAIGLTLGIGLRITAVIGALTMGTEALAGLWPPGNPFMSQHWIFIAMLIVFAAAGAGDTLGLGRFTRAVPWLR